MINDWLTFSVKVKEGSWKSRHTCSLKLACCDIFINRLLSLLFPCFYVGKLEVMLHTTFILPFFSFCLFNRHDRLTIRNSYLPRLLCLALYAVLGIGKDGSNYSGETDAEASPATPVTSTSLLESHGTSSTMPLLSSGDARKSNFYGSQLQQCNSTIAERIANGGDSDKG